MTYSQTDSEALNGKFGMTACTAAPFLDTPATPR